MLLNALFLILLIEYFGGYGFMGFLVYALARIYINYIHNKEFLDRTLNFIADDYSQKIINKRLRKK
ncbi:hypothetical protein ES702_02764 [subsurface metagenome]